MKKKVASIYNKYDMLVQPTTTSSTVQRTTTLHKNWSIWCYRIVLNELSSSLDAHPTSLETEKRHRCYGGLLTKSPCKLKPVTRLLSAVFFFQKKSWFMYWILMCWMSSCEKILRRSKGGAHISIIFVANTPQSFPLVCLGTWGYILLKILKLCWSVWKMISHNLMKFLINFSLIVLWRYESLS